jgi:hypothetical protein
MASEGGMGFEIAKGFALGIVAFLMEVGKSEAEDGRWVWEGAKRLLWIQRMLLGTTDAKTPSKCEINFV